jgi:hypothetical protein
VQTVPTTTAALLQLVAVLVALVVGLPPHWPERGSALALATEIGFSRISGLVLIFGLGLGLGLVAGVKGLDGGVFTSGLEEEAGDGDLVDREEGEEGEEGDV